MQRFELGRRKILVSTANAVIPTRLKFHHLRKAVAHMAARTQMSHDENSSDNSAMSIEVQSDSSDEWEDALEMWTNSKPQSPFEDDELTPKPLRIRKHAPSTSPGASTANYHPLQTSEAQALDLRDHRHSPNLNASVVQNSSRDAHGTIDPFPDSIQSFIRPLQVHKTRRMDSQGSHPASTDVSQGLDAQRYLLKASPLRRIRTMDIGEYRAYRGGSAKGKARVVTANTVCNLSQTYSRSLAGAIHESAGCPDASSLHSSRNSDNFRAPLERHPSRKHKFLNRLVSGLARRPSASSMIGDRLDIPELCPSFPNTASPTSADGHSQSSTSDVDSELTLDEVLGAFPKPPSTSMTSSSSVKSSDIREYQKSLHSSCPTEPILVNCVDLDITSDSQHLDSAQSILAQVKVGGVVKESRTDGDAGLQPRALHFVAVIDNSCV